jgi:uncharacterized OB-fold protein
MTEEAFGEDRLFELLSGGQLGVMMCIEGHGFLPPHRRCPHCGGGVETVMETRPQGEILTYTTIAVPASDFIGESPTVVIIDAGSVRVTARWDHDAPPEVGQEAALWLGEEPSLHLRAHPVR